MGWQDAPIVGSATGGNSWMDAPLDERKKRMSKADAMWLGARLGLLDTVRGTGQLLGLKEDEMAEEQRRLNEAMDDPDYGGSVKAAYFGGLIADPVGWALPITRLKHLKTLKKGYGLISPTSIAAGAAAGGLGYDDPDDDFSRAEMAGIGAIGGGLAAPIAKGVGRVWNEKVGDAAWNVLKHPAGSGTLVGGAIGYNVGDDLTISEKMTNTLIGAAVGAGAGATPKAIDKYAGTDIAGSIGRFVVPDYRLADAWVSGRAKFKGERKQIAQEFQSLVDKVAKEPLSVRKALYRMLTDPGAPQDDALIGLKGEIRETVNKYGHELVDLGILHPKTWSENQEKYLHRVYNRPDRLRDVPSDIEIRTIGDELKMRGVVKEVPKKEFESGVMPDDAGRWDVVGVGGVRSDIEEKAFKNAKPDDMVTIRRDYTPEERANMGEVTDVMVSLDRTGKLLANDVAANRFFREMAEKVDENGVPLIASPRPNAALGHVHRVPKDKGFGQLGSRSMYVTKETLDDLMSIGQLNKIAQFKKVIEPYRKLNRLWKGSKTIANPAVHFNNFVSNIFHFDNANGKATDVFRAMRDMKSKTKEFKEAERLGVFGGFFTSELGRGADDFYNLYTAAGKGATDNLDLAVKGMGIVSNIAKKSKKYTWDQMAKLYNAEDQVFRMALFRTQKKRLMDSGISEEDAAAQAARKAREWFVDYEKKSPLLEIMREGPFPFMSYMYGIVPALGETLAKKPLKFAKWAMFFDGLNRAGEAMSPDTDVEKQRSLMRGEMGSRLYGLDFMPKTTVKLPDEYSPETRDDWYLQMGRMYPGGNVFGMEEQRQPRMGQIPGLPQYLQPSFGAAGAVADAVTGIDRFRGRQIPGGVPERLEHLAAQFTPNLPIPNFPSYAGQKITRAQSGKYSPTKDVYTPTSALLSGLGAKVTPVSTRKLKKRISGNYYRLQKELDSRERALKSEYRAGGIEREDYKAELRSLRERKKQLRRDRARELKGR